MAGDLVPVGVRRQQSPRELELEQKLTFLPENSLENIDLGSAIQDLARTYRGGDDCFGLVALGEIWGAAALWQHAACATPAIVSALLDNAMEMYHDASKAYERVVIDVPDFAARLTKYLAIMGGKADMKAKVVGLSPLEIGAIVEVAKVTDKLTLSVIPEFGMLNVIGKMEVHYTGAGDFFGLKAVSDIWRTVADHRHKAGMKIDTIVDGYEKAREASNAALGIYLSQSGITHPSIVPYLSEPLEHATGRIVLLGRVPNDLPSAGRVLPQHAEPVLAGR